MSKYKNEGGQPREKCMVAAYVLIENYGASKKDVAKVMKCSQSTIHYWHKEKKQEETNKKNAEIINNLRNKIDCAQEYINDLASELNLIEFNPNRQRNEL
jgi:predicted transcriptional regulator